MKPILLILAILVGFPIVAAVALTQIDIVNLARLDVAAMAFVACQAYALLAGVALSCVED